MEQDRPSSQSSSYRPTSSSSRFSDDVILPPGHNQYRVEAKRLEFMANPILTRQYLNGLTFQVEGWCWLSTLAPSKEGGYVQVSHGGANKFAVLQEVVLWGEGREVCLGHQASHLCAHSTCFKRGHIVSEEEQANQARRYCMVWVDCPHCSLKIRVCQHVPMCIKFCAGYLDKDDFEARGLH